MQIVPVDWVQDSLQLNSENGWDIFVGRNWRDDGKCYQWWFVRVIDYRFNLTWDMGYS